MTPVDSSRENERCLICRQYLFRISASDNLSKSSTFLWFTKTFFQTSVPATKSGIKPNPNLKLWFIVMNHSLTAWTLAILFRILVLVFGLDIFIFFSFQCSIIHVWVISRWCHRQSHFERNISEQFYFENNFFETIISKLFSTAQDQIKNWIRIREFTEDIGKIHE